MDLLVKATPQVDELRMIGNKKHNIYNPGRQLDSFYPGPDHSTIDEVEACARVGSNIQDLPAARYGAQSQVSIKNQNLVGKFYCTVFLPVPAGTGKESAVLPRGWGYRLCEEIECQVGNSEQKRISWPQVFHTIFGQSSTSDEFGNYLECGGQQILGKNYTGIDFAPWNIVNGYFVATMLLPIMSSDFCTGEDEKLYFDVSCLNQPVNIKIKFSDYQSIFGNSYTPPANEQNFIAKIFYREMAFTDSAMSLRSNLSTSSKLLSYPSFEVSPGAGPKIVTASSGNPQVTIDIQGFFNKDILSMAVSFHLLEEQDVTPSLMPCNPFNTIPVTDIELSFGGSTIFKAPGDSYKLIQQESSTSPVYMTNTVAFAYGGGIYYYAPVRGYVIFFDFSRLRAICSKNHLPNTTKFSSQVIQLKATIPSKYYYMSQLNTVQQVSCFDKPIIVHYSHYYPQLTIIDSTGTATIV